MLCFSTTKRGVPYKLHNISISISSHLLHSRQNPVIPYPPLFHLISLEQISASLQKGSEDPKLTFV